MTPFDPCYSELSNDQLAEIDSLCSEYESKRTQGDDVTVQAFLSGVDVEIRSPLRLELIQVEMEILDTWDQLHSPDAIIQQFPEQEEFIRAQWESLKSKPTRVKSRISQPAALADLSTSRDSVSALGSNWSAILSRQDTFGTAASTGSTHDEGREVRPAQATKNEPQSLDDPSPRFRIVRNLAQGGIGTVFVAYDCDLQREVAVKELKRKFANDRRVMQRFEAEATVTGNLEHPNIVPIYATGRRSDGRPFYAMRLIQGRSMQTAISELHCQHGSDLDFRKSAARDLMLRFVTVCRAVGFAHSRGVLHRDLKPSNIMVGDFGETLVVDWGLARNLRSNEQSQQPTDQPEVTKQLHSDKTLNGTVVGTPGYMSPEQAFGQTEEISIASDVYSLGATLFQILTNTIPYIHTGSPSPTRSGHHGAAKAFDSPANTDVCIESNKKHGTRPFANKLGGLPTPLAAICQKALQVDPPARYASAELLAVDLEAWMMDDPVSALPDSNLQKGRRWAKSHPSVVAGSLASLLITLLAMVVTLSLLSAKNESLRQSNFREQTSAQEASQNAAVAKRNGEEAVRQRQRVLGILNTFLVDVERGLANVPGSAAVQRNVLTTVLNKLAEVSMDFADDEQVNLSNAMALIDLGDLFSRVGTKDIKLDFTRFDKPPVSPLEAAGDMYAEAMKIAMRSTPQEGTDAQRMVANIQQKQAEILRQTARTLEALELLDKSLATRRKLLAESPESVDAALDVVTSVDYQGQIYLQDGDFARAMESFFETESILTRLASQSPNDFEIRRRLGVSLSRIADIAISDGDIDRATKLYDRDLAISTELYLTKPHNLTTKRDYCISLDRIGNLSAKRGHLEKAMESYLESRRLREELHAAEPTNFKTSHELMVSYMKGGDTRMLMNQVDLAQADYAKTLSIADELAKLDPQNAVARRFQSLSAEVLADVALTQMQLGDALQYAKKSLAISLELVAKDPTDGQMQRDLYICYVKVAKVYLEKNEIQDCLNQLDLALNVVQPIYERQPESLQSIGDYSFVLLKRAEAYQRSGDAQSALKEFETVIPLLESIVDANPQDAKARRRLSNATTMRGRAFREDGQPVKARLDLERSRQLTVAMIQEGMRVEQMQSDLSEIDELISAIIEKP